MDPRRNNRPAPDAVAVIAPTLEEAYRKVRAGFGEDAVIIETRSVMRPGRTGLRLEKMVELTVARDGRPEKVSSPDPDLDRIAARLEDEIVRLEAKVAELHERAASHEPDPSGDADDLADGLVRLGTSRRTAERLAGRFRAENTDNDFTDWLAGHVRTAACGWEDVEGLHAVLGPAGSGRTRLVLDAAARVAATGARTLVLSVAPNHPGEIRRLQAVAAGGRFDAAVIRRPEQIVDLTAHLADYGTVFVDLPALEDPALVRGGELHSWISGHHGIHRHLLVPQDLDPADLDHLPGAARSLNCDWLALGRLDRTRRPGKLLDLVEEVPLPVSLLSGTDGAVIASPGSLREILGRIEPAGGKARAGEDAS